MIPDDLKDWLIHILFDKWHIKVVSFVWILFFIYSIIVMS